MIGRTVIPAKALAQMSNGSEAAAQTTASLAAHGASIANENQRREES
jgi:hypothetical protein